MTTTPEQALRTARRYVAEWRFESRVVGLREDADAFLVLTEPLPEFAHPDFLLMGPGPLLIDKRTGRIEDLGSARGGDRRWSTMTPVLMEEQS